MDANKIDQHLNAVLRAAGSALRNYSLPKSLEDMRAAMKSAIDDATLELQARVAELEAERAERAAPPVTALAHLTDEQAEKADEAIREALGMAYDCMRVWEAWGCGTMGPNDFWPVADSDERVAEIRNAAAAALGFNVES